MAHNLAPQANPLTDEQVQPRGPFWINTARNGEVHVCGRNAKILYRFDRGQDGLARAQLEKLQYRYDKRQRAMQAAAEDLYDALAAMVLNDRHTYRDCHKAALAALAKAGAA